MADSFINVHFHVQEESEEELAAFGPPRAVRGRGITAPRTQFNNDEAAARYYLAKVLDRDSRKAVRGLTAPQHPEIVPDMRLQAVQDQPLTKTRLIHFEQTQSSIPIFGSHILVELSRKRDLIAVNAQIASIGHVSPVPSLSQKQALASIANLASITPEQLELQLIRPADLTFFHNEDDDSWHLAYRFQDVPVAPVDFVKEANEHVSQGHGPGRSPRQDHPVLDYLVDAHDGKVLFYYSKVPMVAAMVAPLIAKCRGVDELGVAQVFYGEKLTDGFALSDPLRRLKTYDLRGGDLESASFPPNPIRNPTAEFADPAAVSAHVNAARVYDFYKSVLMRDGIDDKGMDLISVVNCTYAQDEAPPNWRNAVWWKNRMWYGQVHDGNGTIRSFSRYLDIIAHELTHGVTQFTAGLIYKNQSGALNESFSDIFGVIIKNWYKVGHESDVAGWDWEIGPGLGKNGLPLRDLSNPKRTGDPDHMTNYSKTTHDNGGVHTNSNIHNKAAYNVLTAVDQAGRGVFSPQDVAVLYYLCLSRLNSLATFSQTLQALVDAANTYFAGEPGGPDAKVQHIRDAYQKVGIS